MKILIVAGGTGGHLYPGLALARALLGHEVSFVVRRGDLGQDIIGREGFRVDEIAGAGLPRSLALSTLTFPFKFIRGTFEGARLLQIRKPDWVIGMGGYLSVPMIIGASLVRIKTLIHEQNVHPGLANRLLGHFADSVAVSFAESQRFFSRHKVWVSGLPVRPEIGQTDQTTGRRTLGLELERKTILIFGGSLGAQRLNTVAAEACQLLSQKGEAFQVLHITGKNDCGRVQKLYASATFKVSVLPYCHDMASAYAAADVVICRSGASTICELFVTRRRALLVPYPHATNNHQYDNALLYAKTGFGEIILEKDLTPELMRDSLLVEKALPPKSSVSDVSSGAAARLAAYLTAHPG